MQQLELPVRPESRNARFYKDINDVCQVEGCGRTRADGRMKRGYCVRHYSKLKAYGDPTADFRKPKAPPTKCAVESCEQMNILARGYCTRHYGRWLTYGDAEAPDRRSTVQRDKPCEVGGCDQPRRVGTLCGRHYDRKLRYGDPEYVPPEKPEFCIVDGCESKSNTGRGYCYMHNARVQKYGDPNVVKRVRKYPEGTVCIGKGCTARPTSRGLCPKHAWRRDTYGNPEAKVGRSSNAGMKCADAACDQGAKMYGFCAEHMKPIVRELDRHSARKRRGRKKLAFVCDYTRQQVSDRMAYWGNKCWMCSGPFEAVDHVKPLAKGGKDCPANFRPACRSCNSKKRDKWYGLAGLHRFIK